MMVSTFKLKKVNFINIKISLMLLLQVVMVAKLKPIHRIKDSQNIDYVTLASYDGRHIPAI